MHCPFDTNATLVVRGMDLQRARESRNRVSGVCAGSSSDSIHQFAEFLTRFEEGNTLRWHLDSRTSLCIACMRPPRERVLKVPNPRISTLSPARRARTMLSKIVQTTTSDSFKGSPTAWQISLVRSALVVISSVPVPSTEKEYHRGYLVRRPKCQQSGREVALPSPCLIRPDDSPRKKDSAANTPKSTAT